MADLVHENGIAKKWQIALVLCYPILYVINSFMPWSQGLWVQNERDYFFPFWISVILLHWVSFLITLFVLKDNNKGMKHAGYFWNLKGTSIFIGSYLLIAAIVFFLTEGGAGNNSSGGSGGGVSFYPVTTAERLLWILLTFTAGWCEEFVYRGFGINSLESRGMYKWFAVLITTFSFILVHGAYSFLSVYNFVLYFLLGLFFGSLFIWTRRIWILMIIHMLIDLAAMFAAL